MYVCMYVCMMNLLREILPCDPLKARDIVLVPRLGFVIVNKSWT